jgi:Lipase (class 3)
MSAHLVVYLILAVIAAFALPTYIRVRTSKAYNQKEDQVAIRTPGNHILGDPECLCREGTEDLPFALLSQAAYQKKSDVGNTSSADSDLISMGWAMWPDSKDEEFLTTIRKVHLRVEVWAHEADKKVAVTFGGTVFTNWADWRANLRWFIPTDNDEYSVVAKAFAKYFVKAFPVQTAGWDSTTISLYSTGHSLGGGLAQQFAYALPYDSETPLKNIPRVKKVYAFDPSPVTGYYSVKRRLRRHNSKGLYIDRIYERREILAYLRSIMNFIHPPSADNPSIRQLRYNLFPTRNPLAGHSISDFASCLAKKIAACNAGGPTSTMAPQTTHP